MLNRLQFIQCVPRVRLLGWASYNLHEIAVNTRNILIRLLCVCIVYLFAALLLWFYILEFLSFLIHALSLKRFNLISFNSRLC